MKSKSNKKVFVGMSGGVDSAVSAMLLKNLGYEVTGIYIKTWQPDYIECTSKEDRLDAMRICAKLDIPFRTLDLENEYKKNVIDYMLDEYKNNRVPNPDVMCNKYIKFGAFLDYARESGRCIATGHYARISNNILSRHKDQTKDQSYFLYQIKKDDLKDIIFPLADLDKKEVKQLARDNDLHVADKKESMGICMLGDISMKEFLIQELNPEKGEVRDENDEVIGSHDGVILYTLGERHGFEVIKKSQDENHKSLPYFVYKKDFDNNILYVKQNPGLTSNPSPKERGINTENENPTSHEATRGTANSVVLQDLNSFVDLDKINETSDYAKSYVVTKKLYKAQTRYHGPLYDVNIKIINNNEVKITPEDSDMPAISGQSLVVYDGDEVVLGGVIS